MKTGPTIAEKTKLSSKSNAGWFFHIFLIAFFAKIDGEVPFSMLTFPTKRLKYSGILLYDYLVNTASSLLLPLYFVPARRPCIFVQENPVTAATPLPRATATF